MQQCKELKQTSALCSFLFCNLYEIENLKYEVHDCRGIPSQITLQIKKISLDQVHTLGDSTLTNRYNYTINKIRQIIAVMVQ